MQQINLSEKRTGRDHPKCRGNKQETLAQAEALHNHGKNRRSIITATKGPITAGAQKGVFWGGRCQKGKKVNGKKVKACTGGSKKRSKSVCEKELGSNEEKKGAV